MNTKPQMDTEILKDANKACEEVEAYFSENDISEIWEDIYYQIAYGRFLQKHHLKLMRYEGIPDDEVRRVEQEINEIVEERLKKIKFTHEF
jgi:hypothetical protein